MNISKYHEKLNNKSQEIRKLEASDTDLLGTVHNAADEMASLASMLQDRDEREMLLMVCTQLETSCFLMTLGLYRSALSTLRLALEIGIATPYFSANKLLHREWQQGARDLHWLTITSDEHGVFSIRFLTAFFPELSDHREVYQNKAKQTYRTLCEYVHGNKETWDKSGLKLKKNSILSELYKKQLMEVVQLIKFAYCCRYLRELSSTQLDDSEQCFLESFGHIAPIRKLLGGPGEIV